MRTWGVSDSLKMYNIENWGDQYFNINPNGNLTVHPSQGDGPGVDLHRVLGDIKSRELQMPVLIRFPDIIRHRIVTLNEAFKKSIKDNEYGGKYQGVYPIKVNQMREVVEEIVDAGDKYDYGLEAGSKAELAAVLGMELSNDALIICNGYKDHDVIRMALLGRKLGKNVIIVIEKLSELELVFEVSKELDIIPHVGLRAKLSTKGSGKWENSGGDGAKFGLTTPELLFAVQRLREMDLLEKSCKLLHFHAGSQISSISTIKDAVKEATRIYAKLHKMGVKLEFLDVGGGLGVDYDGSRTDFESSINYSLVEYVDDVVYSIKEVCDAENVQEPTIVTESGRAVVAHHSVLIVDVFGEIRSGSAPIDIGESKEESTIVKEMRYIHQTLSHKNLLEYYHDAVQRKQEALSMFKLGILTLEEKAIVEGLFWETCKRIYKYSKELKYIPEEIEGLGKHLADQYLCNFSLFQSAPDHWAIRHLFPIVPIHRHNEKPSKNVTLVDITCDSDGKISKFIDLRDINDTLALHPLTQDPYYLGFFLLGAYQDVMGDIHNLFGRVNEVHVFLDETEPGGYYLEEIIHGASVAGVLSLTQHSPDYLKKRLKKEIDEKVRAGKIKPREGVEYQKFYEGVLSGYTYLNTKPKPVVKLEQGIPNLSQSSGHSNINSPDPSL